VLRSQGRGVLGSLPPDASHDDITRAIMPFAGPDTLLKTFQGSADRQAARDDRTFQMQQQAKDKMDQLAFQVREGRITRQEADARAAELKRELAANQIQARKDMLGIAASLRQPPAQQPLQSIVGDDGNPVLVPREQAIGKRPANPSGKEEMNPLAKATYNAGLKEVQKDEKDLASVNQLENALKRWKDLNANVPTGRVVGLRPAVGQPEMQEMVQLQSYLAVNNFKPGQGQISNFERQLIKGAGPNVLNDPVTNQRIVDIQLGAVQNARDRAAFRENYLEANKKLLGADKAWNEYIEKNPRFTKGPKGEIIQNPNRKEWTEWFGASAPSAPDGIPETPPSGAVRRK